MSPIHPMRQMWVPGSLLGSATKLQRFPRLRPHHSCEIKDILFQKQTSFKIKGGRKADEIDRWCLDAMLWVSFM